MVEDVFSGNAREVLRQGERAHDPAVPVDDRTRNSDTFIHKTLNRSLGLVDVWVGGNENASHGDDWEGHL